MEIFNMVLNETVGEFGGDEDVEKEEDGDEEDGEEEEDNEDEDESDEDL